MNLPDKVKIDNTRVKELVKFTKTNPRKAAIQVLNSFGPFIGLWILMYLSLDYSYWITLALGLINAFFLVRIFIIQHDCGHRSFVKNSFTRDTVGYLCSLMSAIPYHYWAKSHHIHHKHNGQLEIRDIGDIDTLTVEEFKNLSRWGRFKYRVYRSPLVMFLLGPVYYILIHNRLPLIKMDIFKKERLKLYIHDVILIGVFVGLSLWLGVWKFLLTHLTILVFFGVIAVWFFYIQHQHEAAYKQWREKWDYLTAAVKGSTYYKIPAIFNWLTGNIGIHHIHHLNPAIPNYNLKAALRENPWINQFTTTLSFTQSLKLITHKLWDESTQRMITFAEFYRMEKMQRLAA